MTPAYTISPAWKLLLLDMGLVPERILRRAGLPDDLLSRGPLRLPSATFYALWHSLEEEVGDGLPLLVARSVSVEAFDPPLFAAICCPDLSHAASRIQQYKTLIGPMRLGIDATERGTEFSFVWPLGDVPPASLGHVELLFWIALARLATRAPVRPIGLTMPTPPADVDAFDAYTGAPITIGDAWSVRFSELDAARPFLTANERMWSFFEPELRQRLSQLTVSATMTERVRATLLEQLPAGDVSMSAIARRLAVSKRTLQRRLSGEGGTFQALLNATRESLARHYLSSSQLSTAEIAFLLGYEDPNSFYRAFHAWTGQTPDTVRAAG